MLPRIVKIQSTLDAPRDERGPGVGVVLHDSILLPVARFEVGGEVVQISGDDKHGGPRGSGG